ncbi:ABC transporter [Luteimonas marina]|uniref:ABC transporter n=1 Tax=Luteimonas marina TaxID=488485 RepID=A0A5C5U5Z4_9GAMM|nr:ABC-type transport auxiliary lipoprotein family protein [Luteimonas marina]TWT21209.1 ABC transporter [Luteimonas marina]
MGTTRRQRANGIARLAAGALLALGLSSCSILGGGERERSTIYAPDPRVAIDPSTPAVSWQLSLSPPSGARAIDSFRIAVRPTPDELQVYRGANWAKTPTDMLQDALLRALEDSGKIASVARQGAGITADYKLVVDLRRFEADYAGSTVPAATIEFNAKLVHTIDQGIVASRTFQRAQPASGTDVALVVDAFSRSLETVTAELANWILVAGDTHQREAHPDVRR